MAKDKHRADKNQEAEKSLKEDFGEEGFKVLMKGVEAIVEVTDKFNMTYSEFEGMVEDYGKRGMIKKNDNMIRGYQKKEA